MHATRVGGWIRSAALTVSLHVHAVVCAQAAAGGGSAEVDASRFLDQVIQVAIAARTSPHPDLQKIRGGYSGNFVKVSDDGAVIALEPEQGGGPLFLHLVLCGPKQGVEAKVNDAVILGRNESAQQFYQANYATALFLSAEFVRCLPGGIQATSRGAVAESRTRILSHMGGLLRYFLRYHRDAERGADLLQVAASEWTAELRSRDERRDLNSIVLGLKLIDTAFPFEELEGLRLGGELRTATLTLLATTSFLRRKVKTLDDVVGRNLGRDDALRAKLESR